MRIQLLTAALSISVAALPAQVVVVADTLWTMTGPPIANATVVVGSDGKIVSVTTDGSAVAVPAGARRLTARHVTPGFIDAHTVVGLAGYLNQEDDQDQLETSNPIQPELRAVDAYNAREVLVEWQRRFGTTTMHTGHGPGALASGQTMLVKTWGESVAEAMLDSAVAVAMTLGPQVSSNFSGKSPGNRSKGIAMLRSAFIAAQEYSAKRANDPDAPRNLTHEAMAAVLNGDLAAMITAQTAVDMLGALRLQEEFGFRLILDGAAEAHQIADRIAAAGVPVILHPTMARHGGSLKNASFTTLRVLRDAGVPVALQSGFEGYVPKTRVPLFEAAQATAFGNSRFQALAAITIDAARILGIDDRLGTIATGMDGDLVLFDGDPTEHLSHVCAVVIGGVVASEGCH
jgi:imidazolonepropionase-like amidohydrolase